MKLRILIVLALISGIAGSTAGEFDPAQKSWLGKYAKQKNAPVPEEMLLNEDEEPGLEEGFVDLFAVGNLDAWEPRGGKSTFELKDGVVTGTCVPGEASTYLSTKKSDYQDFIFSCEM